MFSTHRIGLLLTTFCIVSCSTPKSESEPERIEGTQPGDCEDGADNDADGSFDCDDSGCVGSPACEDSLDTDEAPDTDSDTGTDTGQVTDPPEDQDGDGIPAEEDCDDNDANKPNGDADCDSLSVLEDCDDSDPTSTAVADDADCDGIVTIDDCDDSDPNATVVADDADCDGVLTAEDCDDTDATAIAIAQDTDCDGIPATLDCDDLDPTNQCVETLDLGNGVLLELAFVPAGTFTMGSPTSEIGRAADETEHQVTLTTGLYVLTTEVTQGMFSQMMGYSSYDGLQTTSASGSYGVGDQYPAYYSNWHMSAAFANAVTAHHNSLEGSALQQCYLCSGTGVNTTCTTAVDPYQCDGYRLPTEAEWEYTAKAGSSSAFWTANGGADLLTGAEYDCSLIALSDATPLSDLSWFCGNYSNFNSNYPYGAKEVGQLLPNGHQLHDMSGNVMEWTQDYYAAYPTGPLTDPWQSTGNSLVLRGGSWDRFPYEVRAAARGYNVATHRGYNIGFRIARTGL